jgi:methylglyoxal/glyoxal reductase
MSQTLTQKVKLNNENEIPILGIGTFQTKGETTYNMVKDSISLGYRLIDTARQYQNEIQVGQAIKDSKIERNEIFIISKINFDEHGFEKTISCVEESLKNLQVNFIDLMLIHWPGQTEGKSTEISNPKMRKETYQALEKCQKEGKLKNIGVSKFVEKNLILQLHGGTFERTFFIC